MLHETMLLEVEDLHVSYGDAPAIWGASLQVRPSEIVSVIGPNGAGKTTLINCIAGLLRARAGRLVLGGTDLRAVSASGFCAQGVALVPEGRRLFTSLSVEENLKLGAYHSAARRKMADSLARAYALFPVLRDKRGQLAGTLSGGQQQMVAISRALMACPRLLLLDEPSLGLAPAIVAQMFDIIRAIHAQGMAILIVEQNVVQALEIADRAYVIEQGRMVATGRPAELLGQSQIRETYLGI